MEMQLMLNTDSHLAHAPGEPLPAYLYTALEEFSGYAMDDVRVHYNSDKPEQVQALAYAYGTNIYLAPEQEKYLPHEAWHVVQQKQGRVKATEWLKDGVGLNTDEALEMEADFMGYILIEKACNLSHGVDIVRDEKIRLLQGSEQDSIIQRVGLDNLAVPKFRLLEEGEILTQNYIIDYLNKKKSQQVTAFYTLEQLKVVRLCTIELKNAANDQVEFILYEPIGDIPTLSNGYILIENDQNVKGEIIKNVKDNLNKSGQLKYLQDNKLPNNEWKILIDVHFYYDREASAVGFHKDTIGETLFVNLSYKFLENIQGPEWVFDSSINGFHIAFLKNKLPGVFIEDVKNVKEQFPQLNSGIIKSNWIKDNCSISWVDELINHSTPLSGHRKTGSLSIKEVSDWCSTFDQIIQDFSQKEKICNQAIYDININVQNEYRVELENVFRRRREYVGLQLELMNYLKEHEERRTLESLKVIWPNSQNRYGNMIWRLCNYYWPLGTNNYYGVESFSGGSQVVFEFLDIKERPKSLELKNLNIENFPPSNAKRQFIRTWVQAKPKI